MTDLELPQFGQRVEGVDYLERPSVYGLARDMNGFILACRRTNRTVLPGGGIDGNESLENALAREIAEETGHRITSASPLCRAWQYHTYRIDKPPANKLCHFFVVEVQHDPEILPEIDHLAVWSSPRALITALTFASHRWALELLLDSKA